MSTIRSVSSRFVRGQRAARARAATPLYWAWLALLAVLIASGAAGLRAPGRATGLALTAMRDQVSWGFYIGNFTFLVGVAAAAVVLVIPAYVYDWKPIREIVIFGELLAVSAIIMCLLFVLVDIGRPDRFWHLIPPVGQPELPAARSWRGTCIVLNLYFVVNFVVVTHILYRAFHGRPYAKRLVVPAGAALDPDGGRHPHRDGVPVQRPGRAALLELVDPRAAVPGVGVLLGPGDPADRAAAAAPVHAVRDPGRGDLEDRRADGLRDVPQPVPARRGGVQGVLLGHRAPALHAVLVPGPRRAPDARAVRLDGGGACNVLAFVLFIVPAARRNWVR